jgi:uncharacterized membrane protein HdeD (DUF308 family)
MEREYVSNQWLVILLMGVLLIAFGALLVFEPEFFATILVWLVGVFLVLYGVMTIMRSRQMTQVPQSTILFIAGIAIVLLGLSTFIVPQFVGGVVVFIIGLWAFIDGGSRLYLAYRTAGPDRRRTLLALSGIITIALGVVLVTSPLFVLTTMLLVIGIFAIAAGIVDVVLAVMLRLSRPPAPRRVIA